MMWIFIAFLFGLIAKAQAQPTVAVGVTIGNTQPSGIWWQQEYPSKYDHTAPSLVLRYDTKLQSGWSIGAGYAFVGNFHSDSLAVASDAAYAAKVPYPPSRWIGTHKTDGLFVVGRKTWGKFYAEAGPMLTRNDFTMVIPDWTPALPGTNELIPGSPMPLTVGGQRQVRWSLIVGAGYHINDKYSAQLTFYPTTVRGLVDVGGAGPGLLKGYSPTLSLAYRF